MNWDVLGAIAELIGAAAVVITLIYLTAQLRQNTRALKSVAIDNINASMVANVETIITEPGILELTLKADSGQELSDEEQARYHYMLVMLVRRFEGFYFQRMLGFVDPEMTVGYEHSILSIIGRNKAWWHRSKPILSPEFIKYVEEKIGKEIPDAVHPGFKSFREDC